MKHYEKPYGDFAKWLRREAKIWVGTDNYATRLNGAANEIESLRAQITALQAKLDEDAPFTPDDARAHISGLEHQVLVLTQRNDALELIARMVAGALDSAGFRADEVDNPADAIMHLASKLEAAEKDAARVQSELLKYGQHLSASGFLCESLKHSAYPCNCGFDAALAQNGKE